MSYDRFVLYLQWMAEKDLVSLDGDGNVHLTPHGAESYDQLVTWIIDHVGKLKVSRSRFSMDSQ